MRRIALLSLVIVVGCYPRLAPFNHSKWMDDAGAPAGSSESRLAEFSGTYGYGLGFGGSELRVEPNGRWLYRSYGCMGLDIECSGTARVSGEVLVLEKQDAFGFPTGEFVSCRAVPWEDRIYLLDDLDMEEFCERVNAGWEPDEEGRSPFFHIGELDSFHPSAPPDLPAEWRGRLLKNPVSGTILERCEDGTFRADVGSSGGVYVGLELLVDRRADWPGLTMVVTACSEGECVLKLSPGFDKWAPKPGSAVRSYAWGERSRRWKPGNSR
ncbi:MAG: hypothetical protein K8T20_05880 [Planctomycetes bacterium]|nr:hypothetical protein [Planctomycetota bacterium]